MKIKKIKSFQVDSKNEKRVDLFLKERLNFSRNQVIKIIKNKLVKINDKLCKKAGTFISHGDLVEVFDYDYKEKNKIQDSSTETIEIIFENGHILVVNKPCGIPVHPSLRSEDISLVEILHEKIGFNFKNLNNFGLVHRLDKGTSGVLILAKTNEANWHLMREFEERRVVKKYFAISTAPTNLNLKDSFEIFSDIRKPIKKPYKVSVVKIGEGISAVTDFEKMHEKFQEIDKEFVRTVLFKVTPKTGRMHQIRVHLSSIGCPILGDEKYGGKKFERILLHSFFLEISFLGRLYKFKAEVPKCFLKFFKKSDFESKINANSESIHKI